MCIARTSFEKCFAIWRTENTKWLEACCESELHLSNSDPTKKLTLVKQICAVREDLCKEEQPTEDVDEEAQFSAGSVAQEEDERVAEKEDERVVEEEDKRVAEDERIKRVTALRTRWQEDEERERDVLVNN